MKIVLKDIFGQLIAAGEYRSIVDCMVKNKNYLNYADFKLVDFSDVDFSDVDFSGADFKLSYFKGADFSGADFKLSYFKGADFRSADFSGVNFSGVNFNKSNFSGVNFSGVNFKDVNFNKSNFGGVDFKGCDFSNVDLSGIDISCKMLYNIHCTDTKLDYRLLKIQGSRHLFCGYGGMIRIGCEYHTVDDWLYHGAYTNTYSESEQKEYMEYLKIYAKIWEGERWK